MLNQMVDVTSEEIKQISLFIILLENLFMTGIHNWR